MINFLFWNLNRQAVSGRLASMVRHFDIDVVALAECTLDPGELCRNLTAQGMGKFVAPDTWARKFLLLTRLDPAGFADLFNHDLGALNIRRLRIGPPPGILLALAHFPAPIAWSPEDHTAWLPTVARDIECTEQSAGHSRTVLVGDLNLNPFDPGLTSALCLNAAMTESIAQRGMRIVQGRSYPYFYNPMWGLFGDRTAGPAGTYYLHQSGPKNRYWQMVDQVLIRPSLLREFTEVRILDNDGTDTLLTGNGLPDGAGGSDHLPLLFSLNLDSPK